MKIVHVLMVLAWSLNTRSKLNCTIENKHKEMQLRKWKLMCYSELIKTIYLIHKIKGVFGFMISITHNSVSITHNSKMVKPMTQKLVWILFSVVSSFCFHHSIH